MEGDGPGFRLATQSSRHPVDSPYTLAMSADKITETLALLKPDELYPAWKWIELMERRGEIDAAEAHRWKDGILGLMERWGLETDDRLSPEGKPSAGRDC